MNRFLLPRRLSVASFLAVALCRSGPVGDPSETAPLPDAVTRRQAVDLTLARNPRVAAAESGVASASARVRQAGVLPNPELELEAEEIGLTGASRGWDAAEYAVGLSQLLETGGKRRLRQRAAGLESALTRHEADLLRLDLEAEAKGAFVDLAVAAEKAQLAALFVELASGSRDMVAERVRSGKVSPTELSRAEVELARRRADLARAEENRIIAGIALAELWDAPPEAGIELRPSGDLRAGLREVTDPARYTGRMAEHPAVARGRTGEKLAEASVDVERSARLPDVTVSAGIRHFRESGDESLAVGLAFPLPLFDRNRGGIAAARADRVRARREAEAAANALRSSLARGFRELRVAYDEAVAYDRDILPAARAALEAVREAYRSGKVGYPDVLDAREALVEAEIEGLESLAEYHRTVATLEWLIGGDLFENHDAGGEVQ